MRANMRGFYRLLGERSPGGQVFEHEGLLASIVPEADETRCAFEMWEHRGA
jgi:hypothetical protein